MRPRRRRWSTYPAVRLVPTEEEWVCGSPMPHRCPRPVPVRGSDAGVPSRATTAVEAANAGAVMKPTAQHTAHGTSAQTTYPFDRQKARIYEVHTSPEEATYLLLPQDERLAAKVLLNPEAWEVTYGTEWGRGRPAGGGGPPPGPGASRPPGRCSCSRVG